MAKKKKKEVVASIKLQIQAGSANPAPPVGPALGQHGINIMEFCKAFNEKTKNKEGITLPVVISVYKDRSFSFIIKSPPASVLIKRAANLAKASGTAGKETIGEITVEQARTIAEEKMKDLNTVNIEQAVKIIQGTARSMGIKVTK
jgi:large subunit ribosomal protein L11